MRKLARATADRAGPALRARVAGSIQVQEAAHTPDRVAAHIQVQEAGHIQVRVVVRTPDPGAGHTQGRAVVRIRAQEAGHIQARVEAPIQALEAPAIPDPGEVIQIHGIGHRRTASKTTSRVLMRGREAMKHITMPDIWC